MAAVVLAPQPRVRARGAAPARDRTRHLQVVPERRRHARLLALVAVVVTVGSLFMLVVLNSELAQGQFELSRMDRAAERAQLRNERLRLEVAQLASPESVVHAAGALGLVPPDTIEWVTAPDAAPPRNAADRTSATLADTWEKAKPSLVPEP